MRRLLRTPDQQMLLAITLIALPATIGLYYVLGLINRGLAPYTIIDLEFASAPARLAAMTAAWGKAGDAAARLSLWVDYLFMPAYAFLFAGALLLTARAAAGRWQTLGLWLTLVPFGAWACDALENTLLLTALPQAAPNPAALTVAALAAGVKFGLLAVCLAYVLMTSGMLVWPRQAGKAIP